MMLGLLQQPSELDVFSYFLATQLGRSVGEIDAMPHAEYVNWKSYYIAKHAIENQKQVS